MFQLLTRRHSIKIFLLVTSLVLGIAVAMVTLVYGIKKFIGHPYEIAVINSNVSHIGNATYSQGETTEDFVMWQNVTWLNKSNDKIMSASIIVVHVLELLLYAFTSSKIMIHTWKNRKTSR